jgi:hypothetical protein
MFAERVAPVQHSKCQAPKTQIELQPARHQDEHDGDGL